MKMAVCFRRTEAVELLRGVDLVRQHLFGESGSMHKSIGLFSLVPTLRRLQHPVNLPED